MDMGIVNAGEIPIYDDIDKELLNLCEDCIFNRNENSTEELLKYADKIKKNKDDDKDTSKDNNNNANNWRNENYKSRISHSLVKGNQNF
jgi:5-methyltetrahydrofolate--homocysteine methyltransferase